MSDHDRAPLQALVVEDDPACARLVEAALDHVGFNVTIARDGGEALRALDAPDPPRLAVIDWMIPEPNGVELCRRIRARRGASYTYLVLVTRRSQKADIVCGLEAGADDFVTKPFDIHELSSRIVAGRRILALEEKLTSKVGELEVALAHVKRLQGLLPICMYCKKIRDTADAWHPLEAYIQTHSDAVFSHALCEGCMTIHFPEDA